MNMKKHLDELNYYQTSADYRLKKVTDNILVGFNTANERVLIFLTDESIQTPYNIKSKHMSLKFYTSLNFRFGEIERNLFCHTITCISNEEGIQNLFVDLCDIYFKIDLYTSIDFIKMYEDLVDFFSEEKQPSKNEMQGYYSELYTIKYFYETFQYDISKYWQKKDRMKFDFSITSIKKFEIKSTTLVDRRHIFSHEQLSTDLYDISVMSFLLQEDDLGLSLDTLISELLDYPHIQDCIKLKILQIKNLTKDSKEKISFNEKHLKANIKFYNAKKIPKFSQDVPEGVIETKYTIQLSNVTDEDIDYVKEFVEIYIKN